MSAFDDAMDGIPGPTVIRITAVGERNVLAIGETHNGKPIRRPRESMWTFRYRDWQVAS